MIERLFVIWHGQEIQRRYVIGQLWRSSDEYCFGYNTAETQQALQAGFQLLPEFPVMPGPEYTYQSKTLFSTFLQRIPDHKRPDRVSTLTSWGVIDPSDDLEILARSGGIQLTDRLELSEYRAPDDTLMRPLEFRLAGELFHQSGDKLQIGDMLVVRLEPENKHDGDATVLTKDGCCVGYVPRQYSPLVARLLRGKIQLSASVIRRLFVLKERGRWVILLRRMDR